MSDLLGQSLTPNLCDLLAARQTTVVVATIDEAGWPHTAPYNQVYAPDRGHLLIAMNRQDATFKALSEDGRAMVEILEEGDVAVAVKCRASVVRDQMASNCNMAAISLAVEEVKRDNSPVNLVTQGVRTRLREETMLLSLRQVMAELRSLGREDGPAPAEPIAEGD